MSNFSKHRLPRLGGGVCPRGGRCPEGVCPEEGKCPSTGLSTYRLTAYEQFWAPRLQSRKGLFTAHELNRIQHQLANCSSMNSRVEIHVLRTNRALAVLVSLQPIKSWRWRAWRPTNASSKCKIPPHGPDLTRPDGPQTLSPTDKVWSPSILSKGYLNAFYFQSHTLAFHSQLQHVIPLPCINLCNAPL